MRLIGRDRTLALVGGHLADPGARVVTIHGPAGCGKSAVLSAVAASRPMWVIDLADGDGETPIWVQVAQRLGISLNEPADAEARIAEIIAGRPTVLAIDHADVGQLQSDQLGRLLDRCPTLVVVIASVTTTGHPDERLVRVDPLELPPVAAGYDAITASSSVQLFVERAREVDAGFDVDHSTAADVAQVCRLVGGLPLGIELAAARVRLLPPAELALRLSADGSDPDLLASSVGERASRWVSLRAALDSTTASLTGTQRSLLARAAEFEGAFPVDAIVEIDGRPLGEVLDDLTTLVDSRLVEPVPIDAPREPSFDLLPIIRTYGRALERPDAGESAEARRRYLGRIADAAARAVLDCSPSTDIERTRVLRRDVASALARQDDADPASSAALAVDAVTVLEALPERSTAGAVLERLIASGAVARLDAALAARVWLCSAALLAESPDAQGRAEEIGARWHRGRALIDDAAQPLLGLWCRSVAVSIHPATGDSARYVAAVGEGRALAAAVGHTAWLARFEVWSAVLMQAGGHVDEAVALAVTALRRATRVDDARAIAGATILLRMAPADVIDATLTVPSLESALELGRAAGDGYIESLVLAALTGRELDACRPSTAAAWCRLRLEDTTRRGWTSAAGISVVHAALIAAASGDAAFAAHLVGATASDEERILRLLTPHRRAAYEAMIPQLKAILGDQRFAEQVAAGSVESAARSAATALAWLQRDIPPPVPRAASPSDRITPRELEVLDLLANGLSNREIAGELQLSVKTVMHHSVAIYRKLGVRGRAEAAAHAHRHGLVSPT